MSQIDIAIYIPLLIWFIFFFIIFYFIIFYIVIYIFFLLKYRIFMFNFLLNLKKVNKNIFLFIFFKIKENKLIIK
jgi:hypothetical protein